jgi:ubiquinone/menaquinone biosynthesis C-methylase UbiE
MALFPRVYDTFLEPLVRGFREAGIRLAAPGPGDRVLDVGCGTGTHLARYAGRGCAVAGVDRDPRMLERARGRLGPGAVLVEADAGSLPFEDGSFDLAMAMLVLHEMDPAVRTAALEEMRRVAARVLVIDHHPAGGGTLRGRAIRLLATGIERIAGGDHYRNYRRFLDSGGMPGIAGRRGWEASAVIREGAGTMGIYLFGRREPGAGLR